MSEELKPCPFCGEDEALIETSEKCIRLVYAQAYQVHCNDCCATTEWSHDKEKAIEAWNKRA